MAFAGRHLSGAEFTDEIFEHAVCWYRLAIPLLFAIGMYVSFKKTLLKKFNRVPTTNFILFDGLRVCPKRSYGIAKFSQHEAD